MTSQTRLAHTAGFLHLGQSRRRAAAVNIPSNRTCRPSLTAASTGTPSKAEEPRYQPQDQQPVYTDTLTSSRRGRRRRLWCRGPRPAQSTRSPRTTRRRPLPGPLWAARAGAVQVQPVPAHIDQLAGRRIGPGLERFAHGLVTAAHSGNHQHS